MKNESRIASTRDGSSIQAIEISTVYSQRKKRKVSPFPRTLSMAHIIAQDEFKVIDTSSKNYKICFYP
jgi:hypothetical protein